MDTQLIGFFKYILLIAGASYSIVYLLPIVKTSWINTVILAAIVILLTGFVTFLNKDYSPVGLKGDFPTQMFMSQSNIKY